MKLKYSVILLPTDKPNIVGQLCLFDYGLNIAGKNDIGYPTQHLYICSDEEIIHNGGYYIDQKGNIKKCEFEYETAAFIKWKKIVATTNPELWERDFVTSGDIDRIIGIPKIDSTFIQEYVKQYNLGTPIKEVELEMHECACGNDKHSCHYFNYENTCTRLDEPKLTPEGCVIVKPIEERMYTRQELKHACSKAMLVSHSREGLLAFFDKWFDKNYPL